MQESVTISFSGGCRKKKNWKTCGNIYRNPSINQSFQHWRYLQDGILLPNSPPPFSGVVLTSVFLGQKVEKAFCGTFKNLAFLCYMEWTLQGERELYFQFYHTFCPTFIPVQNSCCCQWLSPLLLVLEQIRPVRGTYPITGSCSPGDFESRVTWFSPSMSTLEWGAAGEERRPQCSDFCKTFFCLTPCGVKGDFSHKRAPSFTGLCSSI